MTSKAGRNLPRRIRINIATIIVLAICLCITTFALVASTVVKDNIFKTGKIDIELTGEDGTDNNKIIEGGYLFEPGMTVVKPAYVTNKGTWDVYCKLYFKEMKGDLADILDVTIKDADKVLYTGKLSGFNKGKNVVDTSPIPVGTQKEYTVIFRYPEAEGNAGQGKTLEFTMDATAVQTKNNTDPNAGFE